MTSTRSSREERKNSSFRRVYRWSMGYNRIVTIFYTLFLLGSLPVGVLLSIISEQEYYTDLSNWPEQTAEEVAALYGQTISHSFNVQLTTFVIPLALLFLVVWCARNFSFMQGRRSVDLFHALPVRRTPLFMGFYASGLVSTLLPVAVSVLLTWLVCVLNGVGGVMAGPALYGEALLVMLLPLTAALTFTVFFMVVSGNPLNWFLMTAATALGWPVVVLLCDLTMHQFLPGYVSVLPGILYLLLSPYFAPYLVIPNGIYYLFEGYGAEGAHSGSPAENLYDIPPEYVLWWVVFTGALLALTLFYYNRRKSECAENPFSFPAARGAVRSLMTVGGSLGLGLILGTLLDSNMAYAVGLVLGAAIAHTVYQGVITRGFRQFWKTVPAFVVTGALVLGGLYTLYTGGAGYVLRLPDPANVARAEFSLPDLPGDKSKECYLAANSYGILNLVGVNADYEDSISPSFREQEDVECLTALHSAVLDKYPGPYLPFKDETDYNASRSFVVTYTLKNGGALKRNYYLPIFSDDEAILSALADTQKRGPIQYSSPFYSTQSKRVNNVSIYESTPEYEYDASNSELTPEQREKIWSTFVEELNSSKFHNPQDLMTLEQARERYEQEQEGEFSTVSSRSYSISVGAIPNKELIPETLALIEQEYTGAGKITGVESPGTYTVPECCVKTRKLIEEYTEDQGEYYYYNQEEDFQDGSAEGESSVEHTPGDEE